MTLSPLHIELLRSAPFKSTKETAWRFERNETAMSNIYRRLREAGFLEGSPATSYGNIRCTEYRLTERGLDALKTVMKMS